MPRISDATLRDSAHMAGVEFGPDDAAAIARALRQVGVDLVEVGLLSRSPAGDAPLIAAAHRAVGAENCLTLITVRSRQQVLEALAEAEGLGCRAVMLSLPASAEHAALKLGSPSLRYLTKLAAHAIGEAKRRALHVTFSGEDAARADEERLISYAAAGFAAGADRFRLAETVSCLTPSRCAELTARLKSTPGVREIEVHCHNMLGMAVGNSLAAYEAGAEWISATVGGIGERGGNTPLAELLCALRVCHGDSRHTLTHLTALNHEVQARADLSTFVPGPLTPYSYAYEIPGQLANPGAYENISAEEVGNTRTLRVRTRVSPPLLDWVLEDSDRIDAFNAFNAFDAKGVDSKGIGTKGIDTEHFARWLKERQEHCGRPLLDRAAIRELAEEFALTHPPFPEARPFPEERPSPEARPQ
ncbi:isopropylmalate synthase [Streptomyces sp. ODS28]|uniref:isopropylmalate synthase n=1 Tax=Streptomyces sp. ODS28 TaxID=3136688 RepID=UPI0031EFC0E1